MGAGVGRSVGLAVPPTSKPGAAQSSARGVGASEGLAVGAGVGLAVGAAVVVVGAGVVPAPVHAAPSPRSQQPVVPHGATRSLPRLAWQVATPQSSGGNVPVILFS